MHGTWFRYSARWIVITAVLIGGYFALSQFQSWWPLREAQEREQADRTENETAGWQTYSNEEYGFFFRYPNDWQVEARVNQSVTRTSLVVELRYLSDVLQAREDLTWIDALSYRCPEERYMAMQIHVGGSVYSKTDSSLFVGEREARSERDAEALLTDFERFVNYQLVEDELGPRGPVQELSEATHRTFRVAHSGGESGCSGPGYFVEQGDETYTYVFAWSSRQDDWHYFDRIVNTFRFLE